MSALTIIITADSQLVVAIAEEQDRVAMSRYRGFIWQVKFAVSVKHLNVKVKQVAGHINPKLREVWTRSMNLRVSYIKMSSLQKKQRVHEGENEDEAEKRVQ